MLQMEADNFIDSVMTGLWPDFKPADALRTLWYGLLSPYEFGGAKQAAGNLKSSSKGRFKEPKPHDFKEFALPFRQKRQKSSFNSNIATVFIQVVGSKNPGRIGHYIPIVPNNPDQDFIKRCAESTRKRMEQVYHDEYEIRTECTEAQMNLERHEAVIQLRAKRKQVQN